MKFFLKIQFFCKQIKNNNYTFKRPKKALIVLLEPAGMDVLLQHTSRNQVCLIDLYNELNVWVILNCIIKFKMSRLDYCLEYCKIVQPRLIITFVDNALLSWRVMNARRDIRSAIVQCAWRGEVGDIFDALKFNPPRDQFFINHLLLFNKNISKNYLRYIKGIVYPIGSFRSNYIKKTNTSRRNTLLFISQYRSPKKFPLKIMHTRQLISMQEMYFPEKALLPLLQNFCQKNNMRLQVCGHGNSNEEKAFFSSLLPTDEWDFVPNLYRYHCYEIVDSAGVVVSIDSTLGYEAVARRAKTGLFLAREAILQNESYRFGWPAPLERSGPFWTDRINSEEVDRILSYLMNCTFDKWETEIETLAPELVANDPDNSQLNKIVRTALQILPH